ncbi:hypothetical protein ABIB90_006232 [Bradyrhizobium sp. JR4.1]
MGDAQGERGKPHPGLAAIRSFFNFVATKNPASIAQCVEILHIPVKRLRCQTPVIWPRRR